MTNKTRALRIIFVGVHNKPGMEPLDSRTITGRVVDKIIKQIEAVPDETHLFVKSNLYDLDCFPENRTTEKDLGWVQHWKDRVNWTDDDVIVTLGTTVNEVFRKAKVRSVKVGHPSGVWSTQGKAEYIERVYMKIADECAHQCSKTTERANEYLRSQGYDPDKLAAEGVAIVNEIIAKIKSEKS